MTAMITGLGVLTAAGGNAVQHWQAGLEGHCGITRRSPETDTYPARCAGAIPDFRPHDWVPGRLLTQTDRWTQLCFAAAEMAFEDAGVHASDVGEFGAGVITAASSSGAEFGQRELENLCARGPEFVGAYQSIAWFYAASTGQLSIRHDLRGPCSVQAADLAGGVAALLESIEALKEGAELMLTGGLDASLTPFGLVSHLTSGSVSPVADPRRAFTPFGESASGWVPGEGGALLTLEPGEAARARGARAYAEVLGGSTGFDSARDGDGAVLGAVAERALDQAGVSPRRIDAVVVDGCGDPDDDRAIADAIAGVFGPYRVPVTAPESTTGRLFAGASALDLAVAALALHHQTLPPTVGTGRAAEHHRLDLVSTPRTAPLDHVLVLSRGHGGFCGAAVLGRPPPPSPT